MLGGSLKTELQTRFVSWFVRDCDGRVLVYVVRLGRHFNVSGNNVVGGIGAWYSSTDGGNWTLLFGRVKIAVSGLLLSSREIVVAVVAFLRSGLCLQHDALPGQGVLKHITESGEGHQSACDTEIGYTGALSTDGCHTAGRQWECQSDVHNGIHHHVRYDSVQAAETLGVTRSQNLRLGHLASELNEHNGVKNEVQELSGKDPKVMCPKAEGRMLSAHPTL